MWINNPPLAGCHYQEGIKYMLMLLATGGGGGSG